MPVSFRHRTLARYAIRHGALGLLAATPLAVACACSSPAAQQPGSSASASSSASTSLQAQAQRVWNQFAACMRSHGVGDFPDPVVDQNGQADFGADASQEKREVGSGTAGPACEPVLSQLPAAAVSSHLPVSAADLTALRQFAACMRHNGIPQWPDPKSDGTFPIIGTPLQQEGKSARVIQGMQACKQYWDRGISAS